MDTSTLRVDLPPPRRRGPNQAGVIKTNDDAQATKMSCATLGYFKDEVLSLLHKSLVSRKSPLINRGTWARHAVMRQVTSDFVTACTQTCQQTSTPQLPAGHEHSGNSSSSSNNSSSAWSQPVCQVVALGAGSDSSWFNMQHQGWPLLPAAHFIELDFQEVVSKKARTVLSTPQLLHLLPEGTTAATAPVRAGQPVSTQHPAAEATTAPQPTQPGTTAAAATAMPPPPPQQARQLAAAAAERQLGPRVSSLHSGSSSVASSWTKSTHTAAPGPNAAAGQQSSSACRTLQETQPQHPQQHQPQQQLPLQHQAVASSSSQRREHSSSRSDVGPCGISRSEQQTGPQPPAVVQHHVQELTGQQYSLVAGDLRDVQQLKAALTRAGFKPGLPTLYLCECVLVYLEPAEAEAVLSTAAALSAGGGAAAAVAIYEQTRPDDAFGTTMISNLEARGCPLRSVQAVPTPAAQAQRLTAAGWSSAAAADMAAVYSSGTGPSRSPPGRPHLQPTGGAPGAAAGADGAGGGGCGGRGWLRPCWVSERGRIERLELLDELEEWGLLQEHYCLALGVLGDGPEGWLAEALQLQHLNALD